jgi:FixJ family two-component response regulator
LCLIFAQYLSAKSGEKGQLAKRTQIAVIDDDESYRKALVESLDSMGFGVQGFESAEEFVDSNGIHFWDCIISDVNMPGMSGLDLKRVLVARNHRAPVIMITARPEPGLDVRVEASGAVGLLIKPFDSDTLMACLKLALPR